MKIDAQKFDRIARSVFAPVYPVIAGQIIARTGVTRGVCLDIGCGGGYLGAALAHTTELFVHFFDPSPEMLAIANRTIAESGLHMRADTIQGEVSAIPLPDASVNLAVSRGSIFFWEDLPQAFREIHRVLAPDGWAYIGGGFGSGELKESNFNCPGCISTVLVREMFPDSRALQRLSVEQIITRAFETECEGIVFLMNDPLAMAGIGRKRRFGQDPQQNIHQ